MSLSLVLQPTLLEYDAAQLDAWRDGDRADCIDPYCRKLRGTKGFGEYLAGKHLEGLGYRWIHHDFNVLGGNKPGKYPNSEAILRETLGADRLNAARNLYLSLDPLRESGHNPIEEPDLLAYKPGTHEIRFAECKRTETRDHINPRQALGMFLLGAVLQLPVDVFVIARAGTCASTEPIVFSYPRAW